MTELEKAARQALAALEVSTDWDVNATGKQAQSMRAIIALRQCLEQQPAVSDEPVAWMDIDENGTFSGLRYWSEPDNRNEVALYTSTPASKPLTEAEIYRLGTGKKEHTFQFARAIESKLKEKNNG